MITLSRSLNSVKIAFANETHFVAPTSFIIAKQGKIFLQSSLSTQQPVDKYVLIPTEINGRPSDDAQVVAEWLRDTYFYGDAAGTGGDGAILDGVSSAIKGTVLDLANANPLTVAITDGAGTQITSFGGGTQYTEDAVAAADPVGTVPVLIADSTPALEVAEGDNVAQRGTRYGAAYSQIVTSAGAFVDTFGGGTQFADGAVRGTATGTLAMGDDGTNIQSVKVDAAGELQVDVLTLPNVTIGAAIPAGTNNIGDVDVLTLPALVAGTALVGKVSIDQVTANANEVVTKTGSTTVVSSLTAALPAGTNNIGDVDIITMPNVVIGSGTVTTVSTVTNLAQQGGVAISLNSGVRDAGTQRVTIATNDSVPVTFTGSTDVATQTTLASLLTSSQLIDDSIFTAGTSTFTETTSKGALSLAVRRDANTSLVDTTNEMTPLQVNATGELKTAVIQALPAGNNNIGDVDIVSGTITTVSTVTNLSQQGGVAISIGTGVRDAGTQRVTIATNDVVPVTDNSGSLTVDAPIGTPVNVQIGNATLAAGVIDETGAAAVDALAVGGGTAHDAVDSGNPIKIGARAVSHGANPTAVAAADRTHLIANIAGIPFTIGGHPNVVSAEYNTTAAQTDDNILPAIAGGTIYVITSISVMASNANTVNTSFRIGFGAATLTASGASGADAVTKIVLSHPNLAAGSGIVKGNGGGIVGIGGDGEELRITCSAPTTGSLFVQVDYFTISS